VKYRHVAALALVGWYLMVPYEGKGPHFGNWAVVASFETRPACEAASASLRSDGYGSSAIDHPDQSDGRDRALEIGQKENANCAEFRGE
jgi:hypothetical protein